MIGRVLRIVRPAGRGTELPYGMFDVQRSAREAAAARRLERVYHKGQEKIWNGKASLAELVARHGKVDLPEDKRQALVNLFSIILWGELAAWRVSAELADRIEPLEAKLAATSQAHDEARHFYVMYDYLQLLGWTPGPPPPAAARILERVLRADSTAKKLVGMQLMVEPIALTLFQMVRQSGVEPILCDLLYLFERDEARHIALGTNYLPSLLEGMGWVEAVDYWTWQAGMFWLEARSLKDMEGDFRTLGFEPRDAFRLGQAKQIRAAELLSEQLGRNLPVLEAFRAFFDFVVALQFPEGEAAAGPIRRLRGAVEAGRRRNVAATTLEPGAAPA